MSASVTPPLPARNHNRLLAKLLAIVVVSFAFGFALVPLYDVFCEVTGLNGNTGKTVGVGGIAGSVKPLPSRIDLNRVIAIEFTGTVMPGLPWKMEPVTTHLDLHPGELHQAIFRVHNVSDKAIVGQAIPSISPGAAARHFEKLDCFCFAQQTLAPGETKELPVTFIVKPEVGHDVHTITLAYAFFNVSDPKPTANSSSVQASEPRSQ